MSLEGLINALKENLLQDSSLDVFAYHFVKNSLAEIERLDTTEFTGEIEKIAIQSYSNEYADPYELQLVLKKLNNINYRRHLNIFTLIGLHLQDALNETKLFGNFLEEWYEVHSTKHKYFIAKVHPAQYEDRFKMHLQTKINSKEPLTKLLQLIYLEKEVNVGVIINHLQNEISDLDIIDLLLLEDLQNIDAIGYNKLQNKLLNDIIWCAHEIQSKHKVLNNNENQYNSNFQSLLKAKSYKTEPQTQRGESFSSKQYGELDIAIFSQNDLPLSIIEAFILHSIEKRIIIKHLKKLSENYDPNGLKNNYAVIYAQNERFSELWERYKEFVLTIDFEHKLADYSVMDMTARFPQFAAIKIGLTRHENRGTIVQVIHIFMDMNFKKA